MAAKKKSTVKRPAKKKVPAKSIKKSIVKKTRRTPAGAGAPLMPNPKGGSDATKGGSDATKGGSDATKGGSDATK